MNIRRNKVKEELEELDKRLYIDSLELKRNHIEKKNKFRNLTRCLNDKRREEEEHRTTVQAKEHTALLQAKIEQEQHLATQLNQIKRNEINEKLQRQLLRQNCHELRDLERKLKAAYISKHQIAQIAEKEAIKLNEKVKEKENNSILQSAWIKDKEYRTLTIQDEIRRKTQYKQELHDQMILQEKNRRFEYEEFLREKKMLDDIVQRIHDENEREIEERMCKMKKTQHEIDEFKAAQEVWRLKQKQELVEENRKIQEYLLSKASDTKIRQEAKQKMEDAKAKICDDMARKMYEIQRQRQEKEDLINELMEEEKKDELEKRHKAEVEKQLRQRIEVRVSLTRQMQDHEEQLKQQAKENAMYKEQLVAKIAEDERLEQLSNEKKRRKLLEVRREVERMMTERRQLQAEQMQLQMKIIQDEKKEEAERKCLIQEERIRMLREHAHNLIGYLPKGILQEDDLPYLGSTVIDTYGGKYKSALSNSGTN